MHFYADMRATPSKLWLGGAVLALAALVFASGGASQDIVLFNHSPSVPVGFYVRDSADLAPGMFVTVRARDVAPFEAAAHRYDDEGDRFIKRLAAIAGQHVCSDGRVLSVDGVDVALVHNRAGAPHGPAGSASLP